MTIDKAKLKELADAAKQGHWIQDGFDVQDDGIEDYRVARCSSLAEAAFIAAAGPVTVLALLAEIERLELDNRSLKGSCSKLGAEHAGMRRLYKKADRMQAEARVERDQFKAENEALRKALGDLLALYEDDEGCRELPEYINGRAAMAKEASHD